jgi:hypothetical protein
MCGCRDVACTQRYCYTRQSFSDGGADISVSGVGEGKLAKGKITKNPGSMPGFLVRAHLGGLLAQTIEHGGDGDGMVGRRHFRSGFCAERGHHFALSIPAAVEHVEFGLLTGGVMGRPPVSEPLVPALGLSGAADTDGGAPYGGIVYPLVCIMTSFAAVVCGLINQPLANEYTLQ